MKKQINLTDSRCDLDRFTSREDLEQFLNGFDGIELMHFEEDERGILSHSMVVGYHTSFPEYWMDFRRGDLSRVEAEFDTLEKAFAYYKGRDGGVLTEAVCREYERVLQYGAEYFVFHVSDAAAFEEVTGKYHYTDQEVIRETITLLNEALPDVTKMDSEQVPLLLLENLWQPGLRMTDPAMTELLLDGIHYPRKGIMLDTGHLMHTNLRLKSQKEALAYIHSCLDIHGDLVREIKGIHLNQSVTGKVMRRHQQHPPVPGKNYEERAGQLFTYIFQVDLHRPFAIDGVAELVERISPEYLTCELISNTREEHQRMLKRQQRIFL